MCRMNNDASIQFGFNHWSMSWCVEWCICITRYPIKIYVIDATRIRLVPYSIHVYPYLHLNVQFWFNRWSMSWCAEWYISITRYPIKIYVIDATRVRLVQYSIHVYPYLHPKISVFVFESEAIHLRIQIRTKIWKHIWFQWYPFISHPITSLVVALRLYVYIQIDNDESKHIKYIHQVLYEYNNSLKQILFWDGRSRFQYLNPLVEVVDILLISMYHYLTWKYLVSLSIYICHHLDQPSAPTLTEKVVPRASHPPRPIESPPISLTRSSESRPACLTQIKSRASPVLSHLPYELSHLSALLPIPPWAEPKGRAEPGKNHLSSLND
jgi:hypothetical protein